MTAVFYVNKGVSVATDSEGGIHLALYASSPFARTEPGVAILTRKIAELLLKELAEALMPEEPEADEPELPLTQPAGEFGAEEELLHVGGAGWKERFGVQS